MKENRMTIQTTAQADYADTEQLYTGKNKNTRLFTDKAVAKRRTAGISYIESGCLKGHDNR